MSAHGLMTCTACKDLFSSHDRDRGFERWGDGEDIRLLNNPASWGSDEPTHYLLGFSKGDTQNSALAEFVRGREVFENIPFKKMHHRLQWLLDALGLLSAGTPVTNLFSAQERRFQSASAIRCSVSARNASGSYTYKLKDILAADKRTGGKVRTIMERCIRRNLNTSQPGTRFVMLGIDKSYIEIVREVFSRVFGPLESTTPGSYRNQQFRWAHVAHPSGNQTDRQYFRWVKGETKDAKVQWARRELSE